MSRITKDIRNCEDCKIVKSQLGNPVTIFCQKCIDNNEYIGDVFTKLYHESRKRVTTDVQYKLAYLAGIEDFCRELIGKLPNFDEIMEKDK